MKTIPMLPSLSGGSGVAAHTLVDADLAWVVDGVTSDANRDRKATLAELKAYFQDTLPDRATALETDTASLKLAEQGRLISNWSTSASLTSSTKHYAALSMVPAGKYMVEGACSLAFLFSSASTLSGTLEAYIGTDADATAIGPVHKQFVSLVGNGNFATSFVIPATLFPSVPADTTFAMYVKLGVLTISGTDTLSMSKTLTYRRIS